MSTTTQSPEPIDTIKHEDSDIIVVHTTYPACKHVFEIHPKQDFTKKLYQKALKNVNKEVSIPGYRKGKAPEHFITSRFKDAIESEWKDLVVNEAFVNAITKTGVTPRNKESVEKVQIHVISRDDDNSHIVVRFESFPQLPEFKVSELTIEKTNVSDVTEEEVDKALHNFLLTHATWEDLNEKTLESGDWVVLDIQGTLDDETFEIAKDERSQLLEEQLNPWIIELIKGKKKDDVVEGWSQNNDESNTDFRSTLCKITIKNIQKPVLPELTEEFAQKIKLPKIDDLRPRLKAALEDNKKQKQKSAYLEKIVDQIHQKYVFEVPSSFIESEVKQAVNEELKKLRKQSLSENELQEKLSSFETKHREAATKDIRFQFLIQKLAKEYNIKITDEEVVQEMMKSLQSDPGFLQYFLSLSEEQLANFKERIHADKVVNNVLEKILEQII